MREKERKIIEMCEKEINFFEMCEKEMPTAHSTSTLMAYK